jgi:MFS family permease
MNSTYLKGVFSDHTVGYLYTIGSLLNILLFLGVPYFLRKRGNYKMTLWLVILEILALVGLAFASKPALVVTFFILHTAIIPLIYYATDIFLERFNNPNEIGSLRGVFLTMQNLPPIITPFIIGIILVTPSSYWIVYLIATAFLIPFLLILFSYFRKFEDQEYYILDMQKTLQNFYHKNNIYDVFVDRFLLNLFYSVSVIYLPIYLADYIGFHWDSIGIIFSIMLLPFILFQIPIGNLEDKYHDEKYILIIGFYIMSAAFIILPFLHEASIIIWATWKISIMMKNIS